MKIRRDLHCIGEMAVEDNLASLVDDTNQVHYIILLKVHTLSWVWEYKEAVGDYYVNDDLFPEEYRMGNTPEKTVVKKAKEEVDDMFSNEANSTAGKCCDNKEN